MPAPAGTYVVGGPVYDTLAALLPATTALRDAGVVSLRDGELQRVNEAGDGWVKIPGHHIGATAPVVSVPVPGPDMA